MMERVQILYLMLAGTVAFLIGLGMVAMPGAFYAGYGIDMSSSVDLANELRSPGIWLAIVGIIIGLGAIRQEMRGLALALSSAFYLSYAAARGVSLAIDGIPSTGLMLVLASELAIGAIGLLLWRMKRSRPA